MAVDRGNETRTRRDLFMALCRISQTIFFASRLFSDIRMRVTLTRRFATETKARILQ